MADLDPEVCAQVYVDTEYRKTWDTYALSKVSSKLWALLNVGLLKWQ